MKPHDLPSEFATETAKAFPPAAVSATAIAGIVDWQTWVLILTAFYLMMQIGWLAWKFWDRAHGEKTED